MTDLSMNKIRRVVQHMLYESGETDLGVMDGRYKDGTGFRAFTVTIWCTPGDGNGVPREMQIPARGDTAEQAKARALDTVAQMNFINCSVRSVVENPQPEHEIGTGTSVNASPLGAVVKPDAVHPGLGTAELPDVNTVSYDDVTGDLLTAKTNRKPTTSYGKSLAQ